MLCNVTALYRSHATVQLLRRELAEVGLTQDRVRVVPETALDMNSDPDPAQFEVLHKLQLPEGDVRGYAERVRRGDFLVSVAVEKEFAPQVEAIMRRPEAFFDVSGVRAAAFSEMRVISAEPLVASATAKPFDGRFAANVVRAPMQDRRGQRAFA